MDLSALGWLARMRPQGLGDLAQIDPVTGQPAADASMAASATGGMLSSLAQQAPGSLRRAWEGSDLRSGLQGALDTASYYAGPHLSNRAAAVASAIPAVTPKFGTEDAAQAGEAFKAGQYGRGAGLMSLGVAGGLLDALPGEAVVRGLLKGIHKAAHYAPDLGMAIAPIKAFHGSPHDFDRFDINRIGTGEGAQAYGHGLYFAENPKVAEGYRQTLADWPTTIRSVLGRDIPDDAANALLQTRAASPDDLARAAKLAQMRAPELRGIPGDELTRGLTEIAARERPGRMYEVGIHADPERFLDWDKPLSEQGQAAKDVLRQIEFPLSATGFSPKQHMGAIEAGYEHLLRDPKINPTGDEVYRGVTRHVADNPDRYGMNFYTKNLSANASDTLREAGIPGIRYLDQGSRGAGTGSRNYVTFSDDIVEIMRKYGLAGLGLGLGGSAAVMQMPTPQQQ